MIVKNDLYDYQGRWIYQDTDFFKFSVDSILLAEFAKVNDHELVADLSAGNMAIGLILSKYTKARIIGFELQKQVYKLAEKSIKENNLSNQLRIINSDVNKMGDYFPSEYFDVFVCNPPYFRITENNYMNLIPAKAMARHEIALKLEDIFILSRKYLKNKGRLYLVHRAERSDEILYLAMKHNINVKKIQYVRTKDNIDPSIVLVECIKNSKLGIKIKKEISIENIQTYQNIFKEEL